MHGILRRPNEHMWAVFYMTDQHFSTNMHCIILPYLHASFLMHVQALQQLYGEVLQGSVWQELERMPAAMFRTLNSACGVGAGPHCPPTMAARLIRYPVSMFGMLGNSNPCLFRRHPGGPLPRVGQLPGRARLGRPAGALVHRGRLDGALGGHQLRRALQGRHERLPGHRGHQVPQHPGATRPCMHLKGSPSSERIEFAPPWCRGLIDRAAPSVADASMSHAVPTRSVHAAYPGHWRSGCTTYQWKHRW